MAKAGNQRARLWRCRGWYTHSMHTTVKEEARKLIDSLPDDATWADLQYVMYVRAEIEAGLRSREEGPMVTNNDVRARFGLKPLP